MSEEQATFSPSRNTTAKINKEPTDSTLSLAKNLELAIARLTIGPPIPNHQDMLRSTSPLFNRASGLIPNERALGRV
jgi:hypothetical protein